MLKRIKLIFNIIIAFFVVSIGIYVLINFRKMTEVHIEKTHQAITNQVVRVAELTAIKNSYSDIVCIKKSAMGGMAKAYSIIKFSGVIRIGVENLSDTKIEISQGGKEVEIKIPHCTILDNTLVSQEVFDERQSIFVPITTQEIFDEISVAMADYALSAERRGLVKEADDRLTELVSAAVKGFGFETVKVTLLSDE